MPRILLIDDHAIVREGFKQLISRMPGFEVVAEAGSLSAAIESARTCSPDIAVLDMSLEDDGSGLDILAEFTRNFPALKCMVLSMHKDPGLVIRALEGGARGYATKAVASDELPALLERIDAGDIALSSDLAPALVNPVTPVLSQREREILKGLIANQTPKALALDLGISDKSLYRHRANIFEKLGVRNVSELGRIARERGLLI